MNILFAVLYFLIPVLIIYLCHVFPIVNKIGAIALAYVLGIIFGNIGIMPENIEAVQKPLSEITVPLALPLILFSLDIRSWYKLAGKTFLAMFLGLISIVTMVFLGVILFKDGIQDIWKVGGMLIGVYTGGTPNLAAIKTALEVDQHIFILTHTYDMLCGSIYFIFIITIGQRVFQMILPPFKHSGNKPKLGAVVRDAEIDSYGGIFQKKTFLKMLIALGLSVLILALGFGIMQLVPESAQTAVIILSITTFSILLSLIPKINKLEKSFQLGMYFIIVFSFVVASMADINKFIHLTHGLFYYVALAVFGSLILHVLLSRIFKIDADTVIITSTALIFSPPFVPVVAGALKNKKIIISGLTVGIIGYGIGNYLGVFIAYLLKGMI